jgi:uncharacterized repeat protein (TIGR02543 family)
MEKRMFIKTAVIAVILAVAVFAAERQIQAAGLAQEYLWDGFAADGSGDHLRNDPRVIIFDNFSDYNGDVNAHIKSGSSMEPKRWIGGGAGFSLDSNNSFTGGYSLRLRTEGSGAQGRTIQQWVDTRALRGEEMISGQPHTAVGNNVAGIPSGGMPTYSDVRHREGGYDHLFARAAVMFSPQFNIDNRTIHTGFGFSGGYFSRPNPNVGGTRGGQPNPGSTAGYRSNGFDRFIASIETRFEGQRINPPNGIASGPFAGRFPGVQLPAPSTVQPGSALIYLYGAEQVGLHGNVMFSDGGVVPSTGGDGARPVNRGTSRIAAEDVYRNLDGRGLGFQQLPNFAFPLGEWFTLEYELKLNTVTGTPIPAPPNHYYPTAQAQQANDKNTYPLGHPRGLGVQPLPAGGAGFEVKADGIIRVWVNGELIMNYEDVVLRHTNEMVIDHVAFSSFFEMNGSVMDVWYDNIIVATEYIGLVNKTGADPNTSLGTPTIDITPTSAETERGGTHQFNAVLDFGTHTPSRISVNGAQTGLLGASKRIPFNGNWGSTFNLMNDFTVGKAIIVYVDSPYDGAHLSQYVRVGKNNSWSNQDVLNVEWDSEGRWFQLHYLDYAEAQGTTDFSRVTGNEAAFVIYSSGYNLADVMNVTAVRVGTPEYSVTWSVSGSSSPDTRIRGGLLTVSASEEFPSLTVRAELSRYPMRFATASVSVSGIQTYSFNYYANGGEGSDFTEKGFANLVYTIPKPPFAKTGYAFIGWNTQADGSGVWYRQGRTIPNVNGGLNLYAQWAENRASVIVTPNTAVMAQGSSRQFRGYALPAERLDIPYMAGWGGSMQIQGNWSSNVHINTNNLWASGLFLNMNQGMGMIVYYDSPYDLEILKDRMMLVVTQLADLGTMRGFPNPGAWHSTNISNVAHWDANNRFFIIYEDLLAAYLAELVKDYHTVTNLGVNLANGGIGAIRLLLSLNNGAVLPDPITITGIQMWTADPLEWSVNSASSSINANGLLNVSSAEIRGTLTVKASLGNDSGYGTASVTVTGDNVRQVHAVTVTGVGAGAYPSSAISGETVTLDAGIHREGYIFDSWTVNPSSVAVTNASSPVGASFQMIDAPVEITANWLRLGAVVTGGKGNVTSEDVTYLARNVAGHTGFDLIDRRVANLYGEDRDPLIGDVTMLARWLIGYDLAYLTFYYKNDSIPSFSKRAAKTAL